MTEITATVPARSLARIDAGIRMGPDSQADEKVGLIMPRDPSTTDPFLFLAEDWFSTRGFDWHPHRGIETVTLVVDGVLEHGDNAGHAGALEPGDVQWMTAGQGIIHRELAYRNEHAHTLQLWVNLPRDRKLVGTRYQDLPAAGRPSFEGAGFRVEVVSGSVGTTAGRAENHWPITGVIVTLEPGASVELPLPAVDRAFAYVIAGRAAIAGHPVAAGQVAWSDPVSRAAGDSTLAVAAAPDQEGVTRLMVYSGQPIREPVALGGPFVMNTRDEIAQAYLDYRAGKFGAIPRQPRLDLR